MQDAGCRMQDARCRMQDSGLINYKRIIFSNNRSG